MSEIGRRIKELREKQGISQEDFARRLRVAPNSVYRYESGAREPSATKIIEIARELGVEPGELFPKAEAPLSQPSASEEQRRNMLKALERYAQRRVTDFVRELEDEDSTHFVDATAITRWLEMIQVEAKTWADWAVDEGSVFLPSSDVEGALGDVVRDAFRILGHLLTIKSITRQAEARIKAMSDTPNELATRRLRRRQREAQQSQESFQTRWDIA